jgi:signal transduction histidine kinase
MKRPTLYLVIGLALFAAFLGAVVAGGIARTKRDLMTTSVFHGETILRSLEMAATNSLAAEEVVDRIVADLLSRETALAERLLAGGKTAPGEIEELVARGTGAGLWIVGPDEKVRYRPRWRRQATPRYELGGVSQEGGEGNGVPPEFCLMVPKVRNTVRPETIHRPRGGPFRREGGISVARPLPAGGSVALELPTEGLQAFRASLSVEAWLQALAGKHDLVRLEFNDPRGASLAAAGVEPSPVSSRRLLRTRPGLTAAVLSTGKGRLLELSSPFAFNGEEVGTFRIFISLRKADQAVAGSRNAMLVAASGVLVIGLVSLGWLIMAQGRYYRRINELQRELDGKERLASLGELAGAMAHEIRNPLNAISIAIQRWSRNSSDPAAAETYPIVREEIARLDHLVEEVLRMVRPEEVHFSPVDTGALLAEAAALFAADAESRRIEIETVADSAPVVPADRGKLYQVLVNLVSNALQVLPEGGRIRLAAVADGSDALIRVEDNGPGIHPGDLDRIFDVFYTTREKGIGMGLTISRRIVEAHGGTLTANTGTGGGAVFTVRLPLARKG